MILRPSASHRWGPGACPASAQLEARFPEPESDEAREGTAAHHYAMGLLRNEIVLLGDVAPNGVVIDQEMVEGAQMLFDAVSAVLAEHPKARLYVEQFVEMHGLVHDQNEGTLDVCLVDYDAHYMHVLDYKYGHRKVEAFRNWQMIDYTAGQVEGIQITQSEFKGWDVRHTIVQPRYYCADQIRTHRYLGWQVWALFEELAAAAALAASSNAPARTGEHCRDCTARVACQAYAELNGALIEVARGPEIHDLTPLQAARELRDVRDALARLTARDVALTAYVEACMQTGNVPLWRREPGNGKEVWTSGATDVIALGDALGVDLRKPQDVCTPNQARKLGLDAAVVGAFSQRTAGTAKLVLVDQTAPAKAFG